MKPTVNVSIFENVQLNTLIDTRYPSKSSTLDIVYHQHGVTVFRSCNFRNLRNAAYFFDVMFVAQHDEHDEFIATSMSIVGQQARLEKAPTFEKQAKIELIRRIKARWGVDLMKKANPTPRPGSLYPGKPLDIISFKEYNINVKVKDYERKMRNE